VHAVSETDPGTLWIHTHGMERWELPNIEIVGVPRELGGYAHGILMHVTGYMRTQRPIRADENLGGKFVFDEQVVIQTATLRQAPRSDADHAGTLRIIDYAEAAEAGFPRKLVASYLIATADSSKNPVKKTDVLRLAISVFPGNSSTPSTAPEHEGPNNPNGYFAWENLGTTLCEIGKVGEGVRCLEEAVARWPSGARSFSRHVRDLLVRGEVPPPEKSPLTRFWTGVDVDAVCLRVNGRKQRPDAGR
jgi:hypothetical protein